MSMSAKAKGKQRDPGESPPPETSEEERKKEEQRIQDEQWREEMERREDEQRRRREQWRLREQQRLDEHRREYRREEPSQEPPKTLEQVEEPLRQEIQQRREVLAQKAAEEAKQREEEEKEAEKRRREERDKREREDEEARKQAIEAIQQQHEAEAKQREEEEQKERAAREAERLAAIERMRQAERKARQRESKVSVARSRAMARERAEAIQQNRANILEEQRKLEPSRLERLLWWRYRPGRNPVMVRLAGRDELIRIENPRLAFPDHADGATPTDYITATDWAYITTTIPAQGKASYPDLPNPSLGVIKHAITQTSMILDKTRCAWRILSRIEKSHPKEKAVTVAVVHAIQVREMAESLFEFLEKSKMALEQTRAKLVDLPAGDARWRSGARAAKFNAHVTMLLYQDLFEDANFTVAGFHTARADTRWHAAEEQRGAGEIEALRKMAKKHKASEPVRPLDYVARTQIPLTGPPKRSVSPHPLPVEFVEGAVAFMQVSQNLLEQGRRVRPTPRS
ncbi:uncharacterized protein BO80DRAFT_429655 [Aspergillus ibericus CBS 121593]|uniref:Uncharacterized protein n=1 Tax=Aspergillus ibericus CBS 121593 TaxID=1448316 RepID=A0A395GL63_9EURO|nr:hypothetical protein BO80DRAFT_429655 [Aspergillus ibericus CBS 121593]RAK95718.1 hypothetical protein BO80DRAFT_429655 [Aspergillus ibericus CBS 121593]